MTVGVSRELIWVSSSLEDLKGFPEPVRRVIGFALFQARSKRGIKTPRREMDVVRSRLRMAQEWRRGEGRRKGDKGA